MYGASFDSRVHTYRTNGALSAQTPRCSISITTRSRTDGTQRASVPQRRHGLGQLRTSVSRRRHGLRPASSREAIGHRRDDGSVFYAYVLHFHEVSSTRFIAENQDPRKSESRWLRLAKALPRKPSAFSASSNLCTRLLLRRTASAPERFYNNFRINRFDSHLQAHNVLFLLYDTFFCHFLIVLGFSVP